MQIKTERKIKRIVAIITEIAVLLAGIPNLQIFGNTESDVTITVTVTDAKGNPVEDAVFLCGENQVSLVSNESNKYTLTIDKTAIDSSDLNIYSQSRSEIVNTLTYNDTETSYMISIGEYIELTNGVFDKDTATYTVSNEYDSNTSAYKINAKTEKVKYELISKCTNAEEVAVDKSTGEITCSTPGSIFVRCYSDDNYIKDTYFKLFLSNTPRFLYTDNLNICDVTVSKCESDDTLVGKVEKTVGKADETVMLNLSCNYNDILYKTSEPSVAEVDSSGVVTIKGTGKVFITAKSEHTEQSASYMLVINPSYEDLVVKKENQVLSNDDELEFDGVRDINKNFNIDVEGNNLNVDSIEISSSDTSVATTDNNGNVTIKGIGTTEITVSVETTDYWYKYNEIKFKVVVKKSDTVINITPKEGYEVLGDVIIIKDTDDSIYEKDDLGNGDSLELPIDIKVIDVNGNEVGSDATVILQSTGLKIIGTSVKEPDSILRNQEFTVLVSYAGDDSHNSSEQEIKFKIDGTLTNNNGYYEIEGLYEGADGYLWKREDADVIVKGLPLNDVLYLVSEDKAQTNFGETYKIICPTSQSSRTDHRFYVLNKDNRGIACHVYFGIDYNKPEVTSVEFVGDVKIRDDDIFCNDSFILRVNAKDFEDNLYSADLYINGELEFEKQEAVKGEGGEGFFEFNIDKVKYTGSSSGNYVMVYDAAGNSTISKISNILIEEIAPVGDISILNNNGHNVIYGEGNKIYAGGDITLLVSVDDNIDDTLVSGISDYKVYVNDILIGNNDFDSQSTKQVGNSSININTEEYDKNDKSALKIKISDIYDNAGNKGKDVEYTIYIDTEAPRVNISSISASKWENITDYGNFYNATTKFIFNAKDDCTKITDAKINIGDKSYPCEIEDDGTIAFELKDGMYGNMSISLKDELENTATYALSDIKTTTGESRFLDDYVMVDTEEIKCDFYVSREYDKGTWYNDEISCNIELTDVSVSSGINKINIYINDIPYKEYTYNNKNNSVVTCPVKLDREWIDKTINESGTYRITVKAIDNAGNEILGNGTLNERTYKIDTVAPEISNLTGVTDGSFNTGVVTILAMVDEKHFSENGNETTAEVTRTLDGKTEKYTIKADAATSENNRCTFVFDKDGTYSVILNSKDAAGNKSIPKNISFTIDNTSPICEITGVMENAYYKDTAQMIMSVLESNYATNEVNIAITRELNGIEYEVAANVFNSTDKNTTMLQSFSEEGRYTVKVDAKDAAGNTAITRTVIFTVDTSDPVIEIRGVSNENAYKGDIIPEITISDNYYKSYSIKLTKTGVYFNDSRTDINSFRDVDVTTDFIGNLSNVPNGVYGSFDTFEKIQDNDGIYVLTVVAEDLAGRITAETVRFSVNRFGSVYTFDRNLTNIIGTYNQSIDTDFVITEYNADKLLEDSVIIRIFRDGSPLDNIVVETTPQSKNVKTGETGWYQYTYKISAENFKLDGVYMITIASKDNAGNNSETITYDELSVRFSVDTTKPQIVKIIGLSENSYNAESIDIIYEVFDAVSLKELRIYVSDEEVVKISEFDDITSYRGMFTIKEGIDQNIRFEVEDMAGNIVNSDSEEDINSGNVVAFAKSVTVSTNLFIRWYSDRVLFIGSIIAVLVIAVAVIVLVVKKRKQ